MSAGAWRDHVSTSQRALKRPWAWRMVCWRSEQNGPYHIDTMVGLPVHPALLCFWRSAAQLDRGSRDKGALAII